jgi:hypothetical protein
VKETAFLMAVQRIVGGIQVEDDLLGGSRNDSKNSATNSASIPPAS